MATDPNSLSNSARATQVNQDNSQRRVCIRKEFKQLILWHNWRKSLLTFVILQALLYDLTHKSLISVVSVSGQILLWISVGYRIYVWCLQCLNRTQIRGNPFQKYLDLDLSITPQQSQQLSQFIATKVCGFFNNFRSVAFLEKPFETIKWLAIMAGMSLVGHLFYVSTLLRWVLVLLFTMPKLYMWKQPIIDDRLKTLQKIYNCFCAGNPNKLNENSKKLENVENLEIMEQSDKKIDQKDPRLFPGSEIPEELCAGGDDIKTKKQEFKSVNEFIQFDSSWRKEDSAEYLLRKNL